MSKYALHTKESNRLAQQRLNDLVFVKYNRALRRRYALRDTIDPISLNDIDESNEWLMGRLDEENGEDNDFVFDEEDGLTWKDVAIASGAGEPRYKSRLQTKATSSQANNNKGKRPCGSTSTTFHLVDEDEEEEDEFEFEGGNSSTNVDDFVVDDIGDEDED